MCELELTLCSPVFVWQGDYEAISYFNFTHQIPNAQLDEALPLADRRALMHTHRHTEAQTCTNLRGCGHSLGITLSQHTDLRSEQPAVPPGIKSAA